MKISQAIKNFLAYQKLNSKKHYPNYRYFLAVFQKKFGKRNVSEVIPDEILDFLVKITETINQKTQILSSQKSIHFVNNTVLPDLTNPCDSAILAKTFRAGKLPPWKILERDAVDKFIFKTNNPRNRLIPELMARGGMRIGIDVKSHDLWTHAATYASRSGVPIKIVSKIILRHSNLSTIQRYLGKVSDTEAMYWIENTYR